MGAREGGGSVRRLWGRLLKICSCSCVFVNWFLSSFSVGCSCWLLLVFDTVLSLRSFGW